MPCGADDRLRASADTDPHRKRSEFRVRHHILVAERCAGLALPGDGPALDELSEEAGLLLEELLVVGKVVTEERERVDAGASSKDDLCPPAGDGVERGVALKHPDGIVRAQDRDGRPEMDAGGARRDRAEHHVAGRQRKVIGVVFANPKEVHADLVGQDPLLDEVPDGLRVREGAVVLVVRDIAEGVEAKAQWERSGSNTGLRSRHVECPLCGLSLSEPVLAYAAAARTASSNSVRCNATPKTGPPGSSRRPALRRSNRTASYPMRSMSSATTSTAPGLSPATPSARRSGEPRGRRSSASSW